MLGRVSDPEVASRIRVFSSDVRRQAVFFAFLVVGLMLILIISLEHPEHEHDVVVCGYGSVIFALTQLTYGKLTTTNNVLSWLCLTSTRRDGFHQS